MSNLIARLEDAKSGSFVLDGEIRDLVIGKHPGTPLPYTVSIDTALLLLPWGWGWAIGSCYSPGERNPYDHRSWCEIWIRSNTGRPQPNLPGTRESSFGKRAVSAATPALALCSAAIKAWEQG